MKQMKTVFTMIGLALFSMGTVNAQVWYQEYYVDGRMEDMCQTHSNQWLAISTEGDEQTYLVKLDEKGYELGKELLFLGKCLGSRLVNAGNQFIYFLNHVDVQINGQIIETPLYIFDLDGNTIHRAPFPAEINNVYDAVGHDDGTLTALCREPNKNSITLFHISSSGDIIWQQEWGPNYSASIHGASNYFKGMGLMHLENGDFLYYGFNEDLTGNGGDFYISRFTSAGELVYHNLDSTGRIVRDPLVKTLNRSFIDQNENPVFIFSQSSSPFPIELIRTDLDGNILDTRLYDSPFSNVIMETQVLDNGQYILLGNRSMFKMNANFDLIWEKRLPTLVSSERKNPQIFNLSTKRLANNSGFTICGMQFNGNPDFSFASVIDTNSVLNFGTLKGTCYFDHNNNCQLDPGEVTSPMVTINAYGSGPQGRHNITNSDGEYEINLILDNYIVSAGAPSPYHQVCPDIATVDITQSGEEVIQNFAIQTTQDCPYLNVKVLNTRLRQCVENTFIIEYWNSGTDTAYDVYVELELDPFLELRSASVPFTSLPNNTFSFDVGDLNEMANGRFTIEAYLDCDSTVLGQTHCVEAHIYPDSLCQPEAPDWDRSSIRVSGICEGDSVRFTLENIGDDMLESKNYFIVEDDIILMMKRFQLNAGQKQEVVLEASGSTMRIIAEQSDFHPGDSHPTMGIELCDDKNGSLGFITQFPEDDENAFIDIHCAQSRNSYDPNDKQATPVGFRQAHYIDKGRTLEYYVRFQNTGNDSAYFVLLRDSISENLDLSTLVINGSSHDYRVEIRDGRVLTFIFDDILLPDTTTNLEASQGFVSFSIQPHEDLREGTGITNDVDIFFDFNPPIRTNEVYHTIGLTPILTSIKKVNKDRLILTVFPNPASNIGDVQISAFHQQLDNAKFHLYNAQGQLILSDRLEGNRIPLSITAVKRGIYHLLLFNELGQKMATSRVIIQ